MPRVYTKSQTNNKNKHQTRRRAERVAERKVLRLRAQHLETAFAENDRRQRQHAHRRHVRDSRVQVLMQRRSSRTTSNMFRGICVDADSTYEDVLRERQRVLEANRRTAGISVQHAAPCHHCGAKRFAKEAKGICCKNGKFVFPPLPFTRRTYLQTSVPPVTRLSFYSKFQITDSSHIIINIPLTILLLPAFTSIVLWHS